MNEREAFEIEFRQELNMQKDNNGIYVNISTYSAWVVWTRCINREGYKLVPVVELNKLKKQAKEMIDSAHHYQDECHVRSFGRTLLTLHKAMIGAVDE